MAQSKSYHHGDLSSELLRAARAKLQDHGYESLSLRELARDLGVARSAPYAHFANREALLCGLVAQGAYELLVEFQAAARLERDPDQRLTAACRAFLDFARTEPELYRLSFMASISADAVSRANPEQNIVVFEHLVGDVMQSGDVAAVRDTAIGCLSTLHGYAMLRLHERLFSDIDVERMAEKMIDAAVRLARTARRTSVDDR